MPIKVITYSSKEVADYQESLYQKFLKYYLETDFTVKEIYSILGLKNNGTSNVKYIRNRLRKEGYNSLERVWSIRKGEWL